MKKFLLIYGSLAMPFIAWLPAKFWTMCGEPWCLKVYPDWFDRKLYSMAAPYLSEDIGIAAQEMEFIEVWIASVIILESAGLLAFLLFKNAFDEE